MDDFPRGLHALLTDNTKLRAENERLTLENDNIKKATRDYLDKTATRMFEHSLHTDRSRESRANLIHVLNHTEQEVSAIIEAMGEEK